MTHSTIPTQPLYKSTKEQSTCHPISFTIRFLVVLVFSIFCYLVKEIKEKHMKKPIRSFQLFFILSITGLSVLQWIPLVLSTSVRAAPVSQGKEDGVFTKQREVGHPIFVSPHSRPIALCRDHVFVTNTAADTVDIIDITTCMVIDRIAVGVDPVSLAIRPDGLEVWVSNHVSDSVSVIDNDPDSPSYLNIIATVQEFNPDRATTFDEPVGIAFASNEKAYVALSSENQIAVIDVKTRRITKKLTIPAQDPRAITVSNGHLYVVPFESNNKTQLSGGRKESIDDNLITFDAWEHSITHNNVLSIGHVVDIIKHPKVPDRDLFVFDTTTDKLVETVESLGTLLYGVTVDSAGTVFITQTDAQNHLNGRAGTQQHSLKELDNRAFLNQITRVRFNAHGSVDTIHRIDLEPLPPIHPDPDAAVATPFAVQVSDDGTTLVISSAGSDKILTINAKSGEVLGSVDVDAVPRGIVLDHHHGTLQSAWVFNAVANSVSLIDLTDSRTPHVQTTIALADPTPPAIKRGRIAFETASSSSTGTFSCASCHPDGHTDQLLWVLKTPIVTGGNQIMPRSTMPVRGLRDTEPYHWDGIPGDPYGGNNSANVHGSDEPNTDLLNPLSRIRHLIDGGLASTMIFVDDKQRNDEGKIGRLSSEQRDDMARFLLSIPFPPSQRRPYTSVVTERARKGFELFHILGDDDPSKKKANICGNCHRMPHLVSTNTPGTGMDAPTWRGAYDRFLILPQGRLNIIDFPFYSRVADKGQSEEKIWRFSWGGRERFNPVWDMVLEMSTGFSGAFGRQLTLSKESSNSDAQADLLGALERASEQGAIVLEADGVLIKDNLPQRIHLQLDADNVYRNASGTLSIKHDELLERVREGELIMTLTARHGKNCNVDSPQPAIWTVGSIEKQRGPQSFPVLHPNNKTMEISGRHIKKNAQVYLDGSRAESVLSLRKNELISIQLADLPDGGMHLLQLQNPDGQFSNDFIVHVKDTAPAQTLASILQQNNWSSLLGTWVDKDSGGKGLRFTFRWQIKERVIEQRSESRTRTTVSLMSVNAADGDILHVGADSAGSSHRGTWEFNKDGKAILRLGFTEGDGTQGGILIRYTLIDKDTLDMVIGLPEPVHVRMIRASESSS